LKIGTGSSVWGDIPRPSLRVLPLVLAMLTGVAAADSSPARPVMPRIPLLPPLDGTPELGDATKLLPEGWLDFTRGMTPGTTTHHRGMNGTPSVGMIVEPQPHPDARPRPRGMVIRPPDVKDRNVIEPGKLGLGGNSRSLGRRLLDGLDDSIDAVWSLVLPPST
jgi:hypothetical protein